MNEQLHTFIVTVAVGAGLGVVYDFYRVGKRAFRLRSLLTAVGDLLYWLVATAVVFFTLLYCNWGEWRLYVFLGLASGALLYFRFFSFYLVRILTWIGTTCRQVLRAASAIVAISIGLPRWSLTLIFSEMKLLARTETFLRIIHGHTQRSPVVRSVPR